MEKGLKEIYAEYHPRNIFNMDETGLLYKTMNRKSLVLKTENCRGIKFTKKELHFFLLQYVMKKSLNP